MSEHTEEPWAEGSFCSNMEQMGRLTNVRVIDGPHANIAIVLDADTRKGAANVALIIAAPATARQRDELLAACKALLPRVEDEGDGGHCIICGVRPFGGLHMRSCPIGMGRRAIANATKTEEQDNGQQ